jgi:hypothetical protein
VAEVNGELSGSESGRWVVWFTAKDLSGERGGYLGRGWWMS